MSNANSTLAVRSRLDRSHGRPSSLRPKIRLSHIALHLWIVLLSVLFCSHAFAQVQQPTDYFTQLFSGSLTVVAGHTFTFTPNGSANFYTATCDTAASLPVSTLSATTLAVANNSFATVTLNGTAQVSLYGVSYNKLYIGANGYVTFNSGDASSTPSLSNHFSQPRISAFYTSLDYFSRYYDYMLPGFVYRTPRSSLFWEQKADRVVVTYSWVWLSDASDFINSQLEMFFDGRIRITASRANGSSALIGISAGGGIPTNYAASNLLAYPATPPSPGAIAVSATASITFSGVAGLSSSFSPSYAYVAVSNTGTGVLAWSATHIPPWVTLLTTSGTLAPGGTTTLLLSANADNTQGFASGTYNDTITFSDSANPASSASIGAGVIVTAANPVLSVTPATDYVVNTNHHVGFPSPQVYTLTNTGNAPLIWSVSGTAALFNPTVARSGTLAAGQSTTVSVGPIDALYSAGLGTFTDTFSFTNQTNGAGSTTRSASVTFNPASFLMTQGLGQINYTGPVGGSFSSVYYSAVTLINNGELPMDWTASCPSWLTLSATAGTLASFSGTQINVTVDPSANGLAIGTYTGYINFVNQSGGPTFFSYPPLPTGPYGGTWPATLVVTPQPLQITPQPQSLTLNQGDSGALSVVVTGGTGNYQYQWKKDGLNLPGQTGSTLNISNAQVGNIGAYTVAVSSGTLNATSQAANVNITGQPFGAWQGLVAYYPFTNGTTADYSIWGNNGTVANAGAGPDRFGNQYQAMQFSGNGSYFQYPSTTLGNPQGSFTWSIWALPDPGVPSSPWYVIYNPDSSYGGNSNLIWTGTSYQFRLTFQYVGSTVLEAPSSVGLAHIVCVYDHAQKCELWVNGQLVTSSTVPASDPIYYPGTYYHSALGALQFGTAATQCFLGTLDDVKIFNRALSGSDVQALFDLEGAAAPSIAYASANVFSSTGVVLSGSVKPNGYTTQVSFQYGLTSSYGNVAGLQSIGNGSAYVPVITTLNDLIPSTVYHYCIATLTDNGLSYGPDQTFATAQDFSVLSLDSTNAFVTIGSPGGPFTPDSRSYTITNTGTGTLVWTATSATSWVSISPANGRLVSGSSATVSVYPNARATLLTAGTYNATVNFQNLVNAAGNTAVSAALIADGPYLNITNADNITTGQPFVTLSGSAFAPSGITSVTANGTSATTNDAFAHWTVTVNNLKTGFNTITVTAADGASPANTASMVRNVIYYTGTSAALPGGLPDAWKIAHGLDPFSNTGANGPNGNPLGDGIPNLMKYALNLDPWQDGTKQLPFSYKALNATDSHTYLMFKYRSLIGGGGVTYTVETSTDMSQWSAASTNIEEVSATPTGDGVTQDVLVRVHPAIGTSSAPAFVRLRVTAQ